MKGKRMSSQMIEVTGLWKNKAKDGQTYLVGYLGNARVLIFPNAYKKEDKHPDYRMLIVEKGQPMNEGLLDDEDDDIVF